MPGTNPTQWETRFCAFADAHVRPVLDRLMAEESRLIATAITDINGYLPTHISRALAPPERRSGMECRILPQPPQLHRRRHPAGDRGDKEAMLATYGMDLGQGRYLPVKNVFVPLWIRGRRWGNFELAYRDENVALGRTSTPPPPSPVAG